MSRRGRAPSSSDSFSEKGSEAKDAALAIGLLFPGDYRVGASSLGVQAVYRWIQAHPALGCERFFLDYQEGSRSIEHGLSPRALPVIAVSIAYEPDLLPLLRWLLANGIPVHARDRGPRDPVLLLGGSVSHGNLRPFLPFVDAVFVGEADDAQASIMDAFARASEGREAVLHALEQVPGVQRCDGEVSAPPVPLDHQFAGRAALPCPGAWTSPRAELADRFLVEITRGCPERCHFCVMRHPRGRFRVGSADALFALGLSPWRKLGLVGAAVSAHPRLKEILEHYVARGHQVGLSSLRADVLDDQLATLLRRAGHRSLTVAADAPSQALRDSIEKGITRDQLLHAARIARDHRFEGLRVYQVLQLPGEGEEDLLEWAEDLRAIAGITRVKCNVSFLVPKRGTPLEDAPRASVKEMSRLAARVRKMWAPVARLGIDSPREAWVQRVLSLGDESTGERCLSAVREDGGRFRSLERAFASDPAAGD